MRIEQTGSTCIYAIGLYSTCTLVHNVNVAPFRLCKLMITRHGHVLWLWLWDHMNAEAGRINVCTTKRDLDKQKSNSHLITMVFLCFAAKVNFYREMLTVTRSIYHFSVYGAG